MLKRETGKQIIPRIEVIVDGDVSSKRIEALIKLGREEERLDYKERFDFKSKSAAQRSKVDLVCDMVSMANTDGGYILVGVRQKTDGTFSVEGVDKTCLQRLTQENIQSLVGSYTEATVKFLAKPGKYRGKDILAICIFDSPLAVPFRHVGQYQSLNGKSETKFREGELFVRHGAKSERANYEDYIRMIEKIREDERRKVLSSESGQKDMVARLDIIIQLLGGVAPPLRGLGLLDSSEEDIEDNAVRLLAMLNPVLVQRTLRKEFDSITRFLKEQEQTKSYEELIENLDRTFINFLMGLFPVWITAIDYEHINFAREAVEDLHRLYVKTNSIKYTMALDKVDSLWLQSRVMFLVYCLGAFAVVRDKPEFAKLLLNRGNPWDEYWKNRTWFQYVFTMLARKNQLEKKTLLVLVFDFVKDNPYVINMFEGEDEIKSALCQFDFLQCANRIAMSKDLSECYPNFGAYYKVKIEPIVEKIVYNCLNGVWMVPQIDRTFCAEIVDALDKSATDSFGFYYDWDYGEWESKEITEFLKKYRKEEGRGT